MDQIELSPNKERPHWLRASELPDGSSVCCNIKIRGARNKTIGAFLEIDTIEGYTPHWSSFQRGSYKRTMVTLNEDEMVKLRDYLNTVLNEKAP